MGATWPIFTTSCADALPAMAAMAADTVSLYFICIGRTSRVGIKVENLVDSTGANISQFPHPGHRGNAFGAGFDERDNPNGVTCALWAPPKVRRRRLAR